MFNSAWLNDGFCCACILQFISSSLFYFVASLLCTSTYSQVASPSVIRQAQCAAITCRKKNREKATRNKAIVHSFNNARNIANACSKNIACPNTVRLRSTISLKHKFYSVDILKTLKCVNSQWHVMNLYSLYCHRFFVVLLMRWWWGYIAEA